MVFFYVMLPSSGFKLSRVEYHSSKYIFITGKKIIVKFAVVLF